jgi:hypothetical protein
MALEANGVSEGNTGTKNEENGVDFQVYAETVSIRYEYAGRLQLNWLHPPHF